jgi:hypothetical protein
MRAFVLLTLFIATLILCSCQASLLPFFNAADELAIPDFTGNWLELSEDDSTTVWTITGDSSGYQVTTNLGEGSKEYELHAFKLGEMYFVDIVQDADISQDAFDPDLLLQKHLVARVIMYGDSMQVGILNDEWCSEMIDDEEIKVPFVEMESGYLLTATADQIKPVLIKYGTDVDAFPLSTLYRKTN